MSAAASNASPTSSVLVALRDALRRREIYVERHQATQLRLLQLLEQLGESETC
jgi:hypothetical protein